MGFWSKAKANKEKSDKAFAWGAKLAFALIGTIILVAGIRDLYAHASHSWNGLRVDATLTGKRSDCKLEFMLINENDWRSEAMPCEAAHAAVKANPGRKIRVQQDNFIRLQFPLMDGKTHTAEITTALGSRLPSMTEVGATVAVVYSPDDANNVKLAFSLSSFSDYMMIIGLGFVTLFLTFFGPIIRFFRSLRANEDGSEVTNEKLEFPVASPQPRQVNMQSRNQTVMRQPRAVFGQRKT